MAAAAMAAGAYSPVETHRLTVAYNNLGSLLKMQGQMVAAISCFEAVRGWVRVWAVEFPNLISQVLMLHGS